LKLSAPTLSTKGKTKKNANFINFKISCGEELLVKETIPLYGSNKILYDVMRQVPQLCDTNSKKFNNTL